MLICLSNKHLFRAYSSFSLIMIQGWCTSQINIETFVDMLKNEP